ncbi:MAG: hypothetical protein KAJ19_18970 [Gammaproteobacteria bacterium]|nr:hypothetical protein [Gammaproteobacteria bacterium]
MTLYNFDSYEILTITAILVPSLVAIWVLFLQRDLTEKFIAFKNRLKEYEKKKAEELLDDIQDSAMDRDEESLKIILNYSDEWNLKSEAINILINEENKIYNIGKYIIILLGAIFASGMYSSSSPNESFFIMEGVSRITATQVFFAIEVFLIIYWFWIIFNFAFVLNKVQSGEIKDIEELIQITIEKIKKNK